MNRKDYISYWKDTSGKDWDIANKLYQNREYVYCLFFSHSCIEKLAKALWVKYGDKLHPPRVHNIVYLLEHSGIIIDDEKKEFLLILNDFHIEGRYPDYQQKIYQICTKEYTDNILIKVNGIREWLHSLLP